MKKFVYFLKENEINLLASLLFPLLVGFIVFVNHFAWSATQAPIGATADKAQEWLSLLWAIPLPVALLSFFGLFFYRTGEHLKKMAVPHLYGSAIYFRLVTRGINQQTVTRTANNIIETMEAFNRDYACTVPYICEVVTETTNPSLESRLRESTWGKKISVIELPAAYRTSRNALYKARALHYTIEHSPAREHDWIFHLDDESQIDRLTVLGILEFISQEEEKIAQNPLYKPLIGQGTILYHRNMHRSLLYTLADSIRTADDMGRYFLQYLLGICLFGMHGSFILARNSAEKEEGFDFQPPYCITEDAYWGLKMMQRGYRFGHVYGFLHEQSPEKAIDFIKQRRRWFVGITQVLQAKDIRFRYKIVLFVMSFLWGFSGLIILYTALNILHPAPIPETIGILASFAYAVYLLMYLLGFYVNIQYSGIPLYRKVLYFFAQLLFIPTFSLLEASGALYGLVHRKLDFYVIKK